MNNQPINGPVYQSINQSINQSNVTGRKVDNYDCQALVVPHSSMSNSLATFLKHGNIVDRKSAVLESGLKVGDWNFTVTELSSSTVSIGEFI